MAEAEAIEPSILSELYSEPVRFVMTGFIFEEKILRALRYSTARILFDVPRISGFFPVTRLKALALAEGNDIPFESSLLSISVNLSVGLTGSSAAAERAERSSVSAPKARLSAMPVSFIILMAHRAKFSAEAVE